MAEYTRSRATVANYYNKKRSLKRALKSSQTTLFGPQKALLELFIQFFR